jgi:RNA polymerase sigma-70 factor (ECF subfamily)
LSKAQHKRIEAYLTRLYGYAISLANDREVARDLVQECAVKALSAGRVPQDEPAYRAWLFRILRNAFLDRQRRDNGTPVIDNDLAEVEEDAQVWRYDDRLVSVLTVRLGLARLSRAHREIIALVDLGGFTYAEAAGFLDVPKGTVMSRLSRAREALLEAITESNVQPMPLDQRRAAK